MSKLFTNKFFVVFFLFFLMLSMPATAQDDNGDEYINNEYINDTFAGWASAGLVASTNTWANGSQTIKCVDDVERTFTFVNCIVNPIDATSAGDCPHGSILMRNSNNGILNLPVLPDVGRIIIAREGKTPDKNAKLWLQAYENGTWVNKEADGITATSGCQTYEFAYKSDTEVQLRFVLSGNTATRIYWLYVEGPGGGSGTPLNPDDNLPEIPEESSVILFDDPADQVAFETLIGVSSYGWDPKNKGIYINWHRDFTNRINNTSGGDFEERDTNTRHDSQNDVRALQHYYWFKSLHNNTPFFDNAIQRILPTVKSKFARTSSLKGWMYYVLLRLWEYTDNPNDKEFWRNAIVYMCNNIYGTIDPEMGLYYSTNMGNADVGSKTIYLDKAFRVGHQVQSGAALVDAGTRFNRPEWIAAGKRQVELTYQKAFVEEYGLFGRIFLLGNSGYKNNSDGTKTHYDYSAFTNKLWDGQCKMGEASETIDALLRAADITKDESIRSLFFEIAEKMLNGLRDQPIHDKVWGGLYKHMVVAPSGEGMMPGEVSTGSKEMRQASLLGTYNLANRIIGPKWHDMEKEMYHLLINTFSDNPRGMYLPNTANTTEKINGYRKTTAGYTYQLTDNWGIYAGTNNWVSNESNSLILLGLFEFLDAKYNKNYDVRHIASNIDAITQNTSLLQVVGNLLKSKVEMSSVTIYDLMSKRVLQQTNPNTSYDISVLKSGLYIAQVTLNNGEIETVKFIK